MEYKKMINLLDNVISQWNVKHLNLCDQSNTYILVSGTTTITRAGADNAAKRTKEINKVVVFENYASFTDCISEINNTQIDNAKDINVVMPMQSLLEDIRKFMAILQG